MHKQATKGVERYGVLGIGRKEFRFEYVCCILDQFYSPKRLDP
jgi:hypothetical protein